MGGGGTDVGFGNGLNKSMVFLSRLLFLGMFKMQQRGRKDGSVGKAPAMSAWGPEFGSQAPYTSLTLALGGAEADRTLVSQSSQPVYWEDMNQRGVWEGITMFLLCFWFVLYLSWLIFSIGRPRLGYSPGVESCLACNAGLGLIPSKIHKSRDWLFWFFLWIRHLGQYLTYRSFSVSWVIVPDIPTQSPNYHVLK